MCSHQITLRHFARRSFEDKLNFLRVVTKTIATNWAFIYKIFPHLSVVCDGFDAMVHGDVVVLLRRSSWCCCVLLRRSSWCWCVLNSSSSPWQAPPSSQPDHFNTGHEIATWNRYGKEFKKIEITTYSGDEQDQFVRDPANLCKSSCNVSEKIRNDQQLISHCVPHWQSRGFQWAVNWYGPLVFTNTTLFQTVYM